MKTNDVSRDQILQALGKLWKLGLKIVFWNPFRRLKILNLKKIFLK
jgi:hypothetical protein